ncbi:MAG: SH3 domain-containing protein [Leptolyngbyaceae cyanobacterium]
MKHASSIKAAGILAVLAVAPVFLASPQAQADPLAASIEDAKQACIADAQSKGFTLKEVASATSVSAKDIQVVLMLDKGGAAAKLTCNYDTATRGAVLGNDTAGATGTTNNLGWSPLLWLLLPLLGLPLLLRWAKNHSEDVIVGDTGRRYGERTDAVIRTTTGNTLDVHSGPGESYRVTSTLNHGQRVVLTGLYDNNWAELTSGGWVDSRYLDIGHSYAHS